MSDKTVLSIYEREAFTWLKEKGYDRRACKDIAPILAKYRLHLKVKP